MGQNLRGHHSPLPRAGRMAFGTPSPTGRFGTSRILTPEIVGGYTRGVLSPVHHRGPLLKAWFPDLKIGGCALCSVWNRTFINGFLSEVARTNAPRTSSPGTGTEIPGAAAGYRNPGKVRPCGPQPYRSREHLRRVELHARHHVGPCPPGKAHPPGILRKAAEPRGCLLCGRLHGCDAGKRCGPFHPLRRSAPHDVLLYFLTDAASRPKPTGPLRAPSTSSIS